MPRPKGFKHTIETKLKMAKAATGRIFSEETKRKISENHKARNFHLSKTAKGNLSAKLKGRKVSEETRKKMSEWQKGQKRGPLSDQTKEKISIAIKGQNSPHWKGGKQKSFCDICTKEIYLFPSDYKRTKKHFCSNRCASIYRMKHMRNKETSIELMMEKEFIDNNIPYAKQVPLEGITLADFLLPNRIVVQCDGDYWHSKRDRINRDINQDFILTFKGYKVYRFKEKEIKKSSLKCLTKILKEEKSLRT